MREIAATAVEDEMPTCKKVEEPVKLIK